MAKSLACGVTLLGVLFAVPGCAAEGDAKAGERQLREHLENVHPDLAVDSVRPTPLEGVYEVVSGTRVLYVSEDGRYFIRGSLIDLHNERDLTAERRNGLIHDAVNAVGDDRMLVYEPANGRAEHTITVFTDTSCPYCQRLHEELLVLMEQHPVRVRYLLYPRAGVDAGAADTMRDVWCAPDPQAAMTAAKRGESVPARESGCNTPIAEHYELGQRIGVRGTPYLLVGEDTSPVTGYRPPDQLLSILGISP
ncbi:MAG: DsbC family protein [Halofilum sp. (in: g-proteobacteria)]